MLGGAAFPTRTDGEGAERDRRRSETGGGEPCPRRVASFTACGVGGGAGPGKERRGVSGGVVYRSVSAPGIRH